MKYILFYILIFSSLFANNTVTTKNEIKSNNKNTEACAPLDKIQKDTNLNTNSLGQCGKPNDKSNFFKDEKAFKPLVFK